MALTFSFISSSHKERTNKNNTAHAVVRKLNGVVFIDLSAKYTVKVTKGTQIVEYNIASQCFTCKGKNKVWAFQKDNKKLLIWFRGEYNLHQLNYRYKPFAPGSVVHGHLVKGLNKEDLFYIDEVCDSNNMSLSWEARRFYYDNWEEIHKMYEKRYGYEN